MDNPVSVICIGGAAVDRKYRAVEALTPATSNPASGTTSFGGVARNVAENLANLPGLLEGQQVIRPWDAPIKETGHIQILRGSLAPEGSVAKITGKEGLSFSGDAIVFDSEEGMLEALEQGRIARAT